MSAHRHVFLGQVHRFSRLRLRHQCSDVLRQILAGFLLIFGETFIMPAKLSDEFRLRFGIIRFAPNRHDIVFDGEFVVTFVPIGVTAVVIRFGKIGSVFYRLGEVFDGTHQRALFVIGGAAVDIGRHKNCIAILSP